MTISTTKLDLGLELIETIEEKSVGFADATLRVNGFTKASDRKEVIAEAKARGLLDEATKGGGNGFNTKFFNDLVEAPFENEEEMLAYFVEYGTPNTLRQKGWYTKIAKLAYDIHKSYEA